MLGRGWFVLTVLLAVVPAAGADHGEGCAPTEADPATVNRVLLPDGTLLYIEERNVPPPLNIAPIPGTGILLAEDTRIYQESNGVEGMQRGGTDICFFWPPKVPCQGEPINDENCGHGPDTSKF